MSPEQILFRKVLERALLDTEIVGNGKEVVEARTEAREWFDNADGPGDFRDVCMYAGVDPDAVLERYRAGQINLEYLREWNPNK